MTANYWPRGRLSRRTLLRSSGAGGLGLAAAALVGCGGEDEPTNGGGGGGGGGGGTAVSTATPGAKPDDKPRGGRINMSFLLWTEAPIPGFNLHTGVDFFKLTLNQVMGLDERDVSLRPELVESFEQVDPTTLILHVRKGVKFHNKPPANGREFDAEDVVMSFETGAGLHDEEANLARYSRRAIYDRVASYDVVDTHTVQVNFTEPDHSFIKGQADILLYAVAKEQWDHGWSDYTQIAGTGPFILESIQGEHQKAKYVANPDYWEQDEAGNPLPYLDGFDQENIADRSTLLGAFIAGQQDCYFTPTLAERESIRRTKPDAVYEKYKASQFYCMFMNATQVDAFKDDRVRRAFNLALDRKALNDAWYGTEEGDWGFTGPLVAYHPEAFTSDEVSQWPGHNPATKEADIEEAKKLMSASGFEGGFAFEFPQSAAAGRSYEYAIRVKDQVERLWPGIQISIPILDAGTVSKMSREGTTPAGFGGEQSEVAAARELYRYYHPGGVRNNRTGYDNPDVATKIEELFAEFDTEAQTGKFREIQELIEADAPILGLALASDATFTNNKVQNYAGRTGPGLSVSYHAVAQLAKHIWLEG